MKRLGVCLLLSCVLSPTDATACGDKYVVFGQGVRFQRVYAAEHPATILVYLQEGSKWAKPQGRERLLTMLRLVGHRSETVTTVDDIRAAVGATTYDIVLTDVSSLSQTAAALGTATGRPTVVPMVFEPTPAELAAVVKKNRCAVQVSKRSHELLTVINTVMKQRMNGVTDACRKNT